jgi:hypothetical protein
MKRLIASAGVGMVVACASFAAAAKPSDPIERSLRIGTGAVRDDVLTAAAGDTSAKNVTPQRSSAADGGRTSMRCREGTASGIFSSASSNRSPIDVD